MAGAARAWHLSRRWRGSREQVCVDSGQRWLLASASSVTALWQVRGPRVSCAEKGRPSSRPGQPDLCDADGLEWASCLCLGDTEEHRRPLFPECTSRPSSGMTTGRQWYPPLLTAAPNPIRGFVKVSQPTSEPLELEVRACFLKSFQMVLCTLELECCGNGRFVSGGTGGWLDSLLERSLCRRWS